MRGGIDRLRRSVSGWLHLSATLASNCELLIAASGLHPCGADLRSVCAAARRSHPTGMFQLRLRRAGGRGGIDRLRRSVSGSNCGVLIAASGLHPCGADLRSVCAAARRSHPTGMFQLRLRRAGGRGGIDRLRRSVSGSNCVLIPPGCFNSAFGGLAEGVELIACGDLSPARTAFFIPPGCFNTASGGLAEGVGLASPVSLRSARTEVLIPTKERKGWDSNPRWV